MARRNREIREPQDPLWYKDAIIYELHVRAFFDSNGDGIGDFQGLTEKLDYLRDLGITALWLLPFYPSPLKDDGYDIADYTGIHPSYGDLRDFTTFLKEAHRRGLYVITELVVNHTSDQHPWFQRARRAKRSSRARDFYVWSETPDRYRETRIIFKDFESSNWAWDPVAHAYYWHRFYSHQPDLNFDNPEVHQAVFETLDFWLGLGVDGVRLDAVPYLYEREGTNCENLPETHDFLRALRHHVDQRFPNRMILAEANQWPEDAVAYFGAGDECHMAFYFPLMPRLFMGIRMEDRFPITDILEQTPSIPEVCQWAVFLRNHDELTLEMVTDEERDYMYRVYAHDPKAKINLGIRRRLAPLLGNDRRRIELMNALLFSLSGTPVIYYGDEIGMGENIYLGDRNGVRTPMQWSADRNAGFSRANPQKLYLPVIIDPEYHAETINVEAQLNNLHSLLWWMRRLLALRKRHKAFGRGSLEMLHPENRKVLAFLRRYGDETLLVVANLSRFVQHVELDLPLFQGAVPVELFGQTEFPRLTNHPYFLSLGPHSFYGFALRPHPAVRGKMDVAGSAAALPSLAVAERWESIFERPARASLEELLPGYLKARRWFRGKARSIKSAQIQAVLPLGNHDGGCIALVRVEFREGEPHIYALPLAFVTGRRADQLRSSLPQAIIAELKVQDQGEEGVLVDALKDRDFCFALLDIMARRRAVRGAAGQLVGISAPTFKGLVQEGAESLEPSSERVELSNTSVIFSDRFILKLFRLLEPGMNPDLEIGRFLTDKGFPNAPSVVGALEYREDKGEPMTLAVIQSFIPDSQDAWKFTLDALGRYYERVLARQDPSPAPLPKEPILDLIVAETHPLAQEMIGTYLEFARLIGRRTAELHVALASGAQDPDFAPEPFTPLYQRSIYQTMRTTAGQSIELLRQRLATLPGGLSEEAQRVVSLSGEVLRSYRILLERKIAAARIRCHGDYHLGQLLYTGKDFVIIDFEGDPARPIGERRLKRTPLRDVAGMLRSFDYAVHVALFDLRARGMGQGNLAGIESWGRSWYGWVSLAFLKEYLRIADGAALLPDPREDLRALLQALLLDKALYELGSELNNRPERVAIPLRAIIELVQGPSRW
jgi:maltose alpha-D-glucosyltransferase / alpha-amylase